MPKPAKGHTGIPTRLDYAELKAQLITTGKCEKQFTSLDDFCDDGSPREVRNLQRRLSGFCKSVGWRVKTKFDKATLIFKAEVRR